MKKSPKRVLAISGSIKSKSSSLSILHFLKEKYSDKFEFNIYNRIGELPHFNPELEAQVSDSVVELRNLVNNSDGVLFCTPEYVFSLPGSLKNLIEWNVSTVLFTNKPVAMIVAAASGQKAFESLALILTTIESALPETSRLLIQGAKGKLSKNGVLTDQETIEHLDTVMTSLLETINDTNRKPTKYR